MRNSLTTWHSSFNSIHTNNEPNKPVLTILVKYDVMLSVPQYQISPIEQPFVGNNETTSILTPQ